MIQKLALKIGLKQGDRCPDHDTLMIREIYVHQKPRDPKLQESIDSISDPRLRKTMERGLRDMGM